MARLFWWWTYMASIFSSLLKIIMFQAIIYMSMPKTVKLFSGTTLLLSTSSPWGLMITLQTKWQQNPSLKDLKRMGEMVFECHVVQIQKVKYVKHNVSTTSSLHKEAVDYVSLRVRMEFHIPTHIQLNANLGRRYQFCPLYCLKESIGQNLYYFLLYGLWEKRQDSCEKLKCQCLNAYKSF